MIAWDEFWTVIQPLPVIAGWLVGIAAVVGFFAKVWPWVRKFVRTVDIVISLTETMPKLEQDVAAIKHEVLPNGGGSLKDQATRTEKAVTELKAEVAHVRRQGAATKTTLARTTRALEEHIANTKENAS